MAKSERVSFPRPHDPRDPQVMLVAEAYARAARDGAAGGEAEVLDRIARDLVLERSAVDGLIAAARFFKVPGASVAIAQDHAAPTDRLSVTDPRAEGLVDPLGLGTASPHFSWSVRSLQDRVSQGAYRIQVASTPEALAEGAADLWDSGFVLSVRACEVAYAGKPLVSRQRCYWRVLVRDGAAEDFAVSRMAMFETGLFAPSDEFRADWITLLYPGQTREQHDPVPHVRRTFVSTKTVVRACLYVSALGLYRLWVNAREITAQSLLRPGWTDYAKRLQLQAFDVTHALQNGSNVLHGLIGKGWYAGHAGFMGQRGIYGETPALAVQLEIQYTDGSTQTVLTDGQWEGVFGALQTSDMLTGEVYDARLAIDPLSSEGPWGPVESLDRPAATLVMQAGASCRPSMVLPAQEAIKLGTLRSWYVFDFGQNLVGRTRLTIRNAKRGTELVIKHGEMLNREGGVYLANLRAATQEDRYICRGDPVEIYESSFTLHGFRYVEIKDLPQPLEADSVTAVVIDQGAELAGDFTCGAGHLNALQAAIQWTARGNFIEVQTDCPQRNERLGWLGDAHYFARTAIANFDYAPFYRKWMRDILDAQLPEGDFPDVAPNIAFPWVGAPGWADFAAVLPWMLLHAYGDRRTADTAFDAIARWANRIEEANPDGIRRKRVGNNYGDWLSQPLSALQTNAQSDASTFGTSPTHVVGSALTARVLEALSDLAARLERPEAAALAARYKRQAEIFASAFVQPDGLIEGDTQTIYAQALRFGLVPEAHRGSAVGHLAARVEEAGRRPLVGLMGVDHLMPALADGGHEALALDLLLQRAWPSWGYMIDQGATTIWERWDGWSPEHGFQDVRMNSFNHVALGSVGAYFFDTLAGIRVDMADPERPQVVIAPHPDPRLGQVRGLRRTPAGTIFVHWHYETPERLGLTIRLDGIAAAELDLRSQGFAKTRRITGTAHHSAPVPKSLSLSAGDTKLVFELG